ncbi:hypothetical protein [Bacillus sp. NPDC077027]|uniref:hypothetical protein n=1 Tax=Bacillus sp. NPDC077027 TaxID=3390548 RepID=UPI003CFE6841
MEIMMMSLFTAILLGMTVIFIWGVLRQAKRKKQLTSRSAILYGLVTLIGAYLLFTVFFMLYQWIL